MFPKINKMFFKKKTRADTQPQTAVYINDIYEELCGGGYTKLSQNAEIVAGVNKIADLISSMTIYLMENGQSGDTRIKNGLSQKIDISPNEYTTRKNFMSAVVRTLLLEGDGNSVVLPETKNGLIENLYPVPAQEVGFVPNGVGYKIHIRGIEYDPSEVLHFAINPSPMCYWRGTGYRTALKEVAENLKQANATKKGFMQSKWKPSMIISVDAMTEELSTPEKREEILKKYFESTEKGVPWVIPSEQFDIKEIRPLTLNDIAITDGVKLDKKTVSAILGVPSFVVGEGEYSKDEWNNFITTRIRPICQVIEQELTKKLLYKQEWYFKFSLMSLYSYDIRTLAEVGSMLYTRGIMTGNEVRDWMGKSPKDGLDKHIILENYIPQEKIGEQSKLKNEE